MAQYSSIQPGKLELDDAIKDLLSLSYELTAPKKRSKKSSAKNPGDSANGKEKNLTKAEQKKARLRQRRMEREAKERGTAGRTV